MLQENVGKLRRLRAIARITTGTDQTSAMKSIAGMVSLNIQLRRLVMIMFVSRVTDEKYLQWQCKKTCDLCNVDPSRKEMDQICNALIPDSVKAKYRSDVKPKHKGQKSKFNTVNTATNVKQKVKKPKELPRRGGGSKSVTIEYFDKKENKILLKTQTNTQNSVQFKTSPRKSPLPFTSLPATKSKAPTSATKFKAPPSGTKTKSPSSPAAAPATKSKKPSSKKSKGGFVVINDPERRRKLRSFWMRAG